VVGGNQLGTWSGGRKSFRDKEWSEETWCGGKKSVRDKEWWEEIR